MSKMTKKEYAEWIASLNKERHTVFVYGSLREGEGNNHVLHENAIKYGGMDAIRKGDPIQRVKGFAMYPINQTNAYPFCIESEEETDVVTVECYEVDGVGLILLDQLEGYPDFYNRKEVTNESGDITGWVYYIESAMPNDLPMVEDGDWVKHCNKYREALASRGKRV